MPSPARAKQRILEAVAPILGEHRQRVMTLESQRHFALDDLKSLASQGIFRAGEGESSSDIELSRFYEAVAEQACDLPFISSLAAHGAIALGLWRRYTPTLLKEKFTDALLSGESLAAVANHESGTAVSLRPMGTRVVGSALIGAKQIATNAPHAGLFLLSAWEETNIQIFLVERKNGLSTIDLRESMAGFWTGSTGSLQLHDYAFDPQGARLSRTGNSFELLQYCFDLERLFMASIALGTLRAVEREASESARAKRLKLILEAQYLQEKLFTLHKTRLQLEGLVELARREFSANSVLRSGALAVCKEFLCNDLTQAAQAWIALEGGAALTSLHPAQKFYRDVQMLKFFGGSAELQKTDWINKWFGVEQSRRNDREAA